MTNEQYLVFSYFTVGFLSLAIALSTYHLLRKSFMSVTQDVPGKLSIIIRRLFIIGIILPALTGFFSVSFRSCSKDTYVKIIADRSYLIEINQEQLSAILSYIVIALMIWGLIIIGILFLKNGQKFTDRG